MKDPNDPNPSNAGKKSAYYLKADGPVWKVWPAEGPGGVVTAAMVEFVNVHGVSNGTNGTLLVEGVVKINGIKWLGGQDAVVDYLRFQMPEQRVNVGVISARASITPM